MNIEDLDLDKLTEAGVICDVSFDKVDFIDPRNPNGIEEAFFETVSFTFAGETVSKDRDIRVEGRRDFLTEMITGEPCVIGKTKGQLREDAAREAIREHFEAASSHRKIQIMAALSRADRT